MRVPAHHHAYIYIYSYTYAHARALATDLRWAAKKRKSIQP